MIEIKDFNKASIQEAIQVWNEVVEQGVAFPQMECLDEESGLAFFQSQSKTRLAYIDQEVVGLYILHPNNVGRCGHICNASYAVASKCRGKHIGQALVEDCLEQAKVCGFRILQFNAVVASNHAALNLYKKLGFQPLGIIPKGFLLKSGEYEDIIPHYISLD